DVSDEPGDCSVKYQKVGCYNENSGDRLLTKQVFSMRDEIDWTPGKWENFLKKQVFIQRYRNIEFVNELIRLFYPRLACRCAKETRAFGYSHFGLQFFAECWSDAQAKERYNRYGKSSVCTGFEYKTCNDKDENECVGGGNKNYVYEIVEEGKESKILKKLVFSRILENYIFKPGSFITLTQLPSLESATGQQSTCEQSYYKLGCYQDRRWIRAMSELLINDRDPTSAKYGMPVDWHNWNDYLQSLACRCAQAALNHSYIMFGLQNYGECWSGSDACDQYSRHGDSKLCIGNNYTMCDLNDDSECIGKGNANFVYLLLEGKPLKTLG
ncbi:unnamed protein product, partial [Porites lobata]